MPAILFPHATIQKIEIHIHYYEHADTASTNTSSDQKPSDDFRDSDSANNAGCDPGRQPESDTRDDACFDEAPPHPSDYDEAESYVEDDPHDEADPRPEDDLYPADDLYPEDYEDSFYRKDYYDEIDAYTEGYELSDEDGWFYPDEG